MTGSCPNAATSIYIQGESRGGVWNEDSRGSLEASTSDGFSTQTGPHLVVSNHNHFSDVWIKRKLFRHPSPRQTGILKHLTKNRPRAPGACLPTPGACLLAPGVASPPLGLPPRPWGDLPTTGACLLAPGPCVRPGSQLG